MRRILHLFDGDADWEQRVAVGQLLDRIERSQAEQFVGSVHAGVPQTGSFRPNRVHRSPMRFDLPLTAVTSLRRLLDRLRVDIVHAWGPDAAVAAAEAKGGSCILVATHFDPCIGAPDGKRWRAIAETKPFAIACSTQMVRRRLIEKGVPGDRCVVIRPGVDFGAINRAKKDSSIRARIGVAPSERLVLIGYPYGPSLPIDRVIWCAELQHYLDESFRFVVYGSHGELEPLRRLAAQLPFSGAVILVERPFDYESLIPVADALVMTPTDDQSTTAIGWAMAASVPVVGTAVYSVAELIAHKHNGLLIKPQAGQPLAIEIARCLRQIDEMAKEKEVARGQAYEVFGVRRFVDQTWRLFENLEADGEACAGIDDSASLG